jgi:hypothetical protein
MRCSLAMAGFVSFIPLVYDIVQTYGCAVGDSPCVKRRELTTQQASSVPCPTCGASVGEPCELHSGVPRSKPHVDREFAAIEAVERK